MVSATTKKHACALRRSVGPARPEFNACGNVSVAAAGDRERGEAIVPIRIVVDENGFVVSSEFVPEREPPKPLGKRKGSTVKKSGAKPRSVTGAKKAPAYSDASARTSLCPVCGITVASDRLGRHRRKVHSGRGGAGSGASRTHEPRKLLPKGLSPQQTPGGRRMVRCSACDVNLKDSNWEKHLAKVHPAKAGYSGGKARPSSGGTSRKKGRGVSVANPNQGERTTRALFEETSFGDKYLGQARREPEGRFGSLPLYDDYGEESGPD